MDFVYINDLTGEMLAVRKPDDMATLPFLQTLVDGYIECVSLDRTTDLWLNEEGLFRDDFRVNRIATTFRGAGYQTPLVGPAVLATSNSRGETLGAPQLYLSTAKLDENGKPFSPDKIVAMRNAQAKQVTL